MSDYIIENGRSNVCDPTLFRQETIRTLEEIIKILKPICGPHARYYALNQHNDGLVEQGVPEFVKDGIKTLSAVKFESPIQNAVKALIVHFGSKVETKTGDGTTTTMLIVCHMLLGILQDKEFITVIDSLNNYGIKKLVRVLKQIVPVSFSIDDLVKQGFDRKAAIEKMVYHQSMCSSHGDTELSQVVAQWFKRIPEAACDYCFPERAFIETDKEISIEEYAWQYTFYNCQNVGDHIFNNKVSRIANHMNCDVYIANFVVNQLERIEWNGIRDLIVGKQTIKMVDNESIPMREGAPTKPTLLIVEGVAGNTEQALLDLMRENPNVFVVCTSVRKDETLTQLHTISLLTNPEHDHTIDTAMPFYVGNTEIEYLPNRLRIRTLLETEEDGITISEKHIGKSIVALRKDTISEIEMLAKEHRTKTQADNSELLRRRFLELNYVGIPVLKIGGGQYANTTYFEVVKDVIKASRHAIKHGVEPGACSGLFFGVDKLLKDADLPINERMLLKKFQSAVTDIAGILSENAGFNVDHISHTWYDAAKNNQIACYNVLTNRVDTLPASFMREFEEDDYLVIQTCGVNDSLLSRLVDFLNQWLCIKTYITAGMGYYPSGD